MLHSDAGHPAQAVRPPAGRDAHRHPYGGLRKRLPIAQVHGDRGSCGRREPHLLDEGNFWRTLKKIGSVTSFV